MPPVESSLSEAEIERWLGRQGQPDMRLEPLAGDVSARRYLRATRDGASLVVAVYPPSLNHACERFLRTTDLLETAGLRVPAVLAADCEMGLMLLEDLGPKTLYDLRGGSWPVLRPHLERAVAELARLVRVDPPTVAALNPPLDEALLRRELEQSWRSFLTPRGLGGDGRSTSELRAALDELCRRLGEAPPVVCHRDFMARNLVPQADGRLGILDHQDLRLGPPSYDLASLLNDSLFPPADLIDELAGTAAREIGYHRAAAQRTLKAVGTFATFAERGDPRHLGLIPPTLERCLAHLLRLPESAEIAGRLAERWRAVC